MQGRAREANDSLDTLRHLQPNTHDTQAAERAVRRVLASAADPGVSLYGDSSGLEVQRVAPHAIVQWSTGTTVTAGYDARAAHRSRGKRSRAGRRTPGCEARTDLGHCGAASSA